MFDAKAALLIRMIWWNVIQVIKHTDYSSREEFDMAVNSSLVKAGVEIICLAGFMRVLTGAFVRQWRGRLLNIHPALLPLFKGTHAHRQALDAGVRVTGCTVHFVEVSISIVLIDYTVRFAPALRPLEWTFSFLSINLNVLCCCLFNFDLDWKQIGNFPQFCYADVL